MGEGRSAFIVDNRETDVTDKVQGYLEKWCEVSRQFDIATGYFEVGALSRLDGEWQKLDKIRILMGHEVSRSTKETLVTAITEQLDNSFDEEKEKHGNEFLRGIPAIIEAIRSGKIECRVYTPHKFHAKMYITHAKHDIMGPVALVGSSNFTVPGISKNIELNVRIETGHQVVELQEWFEHFWEHEGTEPINEEVLEVMETHAHEYEPFLLYGKSLEEYFRDKETVGPTVWHEKDIEKGGSIIWKDLDKYQQDGYLALIDIANTHGGAFLCDGVGLGKTYQGLMLIERLAGYEGKNVLLLTPRAIHESVWEPQLKDKLPSLAGWASNFEHRAHTDLTNKKFKEDWELAQKRFDVVIIDEAHNFRNRGNQNQKYNALYDFINNGRKKAVYFLTATPINNNIKDLRNMIELFTNSNRKHFNNTGVPNTESHFNKLQRNIKSIIKDSIEEGKLDDAEIDSGTMSRSDVQNEFKRDKLVRSLVVQRSRKFVVESQKINSRRKIDFPEPQDPKVWQYDLEKVYGEFLHEFAESFGEDDNLFNLSFYYPYNHYRHGEPDNIETHRERTRLKQIGRLIRIGFLKSFESSINSFEWRCNKLLLKVIAWLRAHQLDDERLANRINKWINENNETLIYASNFTQKESGMNDEFEEEDLDDCLPDVDKNIWSDEDFDVRAIIDETYSDLELLASFSFKLSKFSVSDDAKLNRLVKLIETDAASNTNKIIIFSEFTKTGQYLHKHLCNRLPHLNIEQIDGSTSASRKDIVERFSPYYNKSSSKKLLDNGKNEIDILVSSDVLAEGLNLQDSTKLINYDIHWNPVKLMQRIGRIDRRLDPDVEELIKEAHPERSDERGKIDYWNFLPPKQLETILGLHNRVNNKLLSISIVFGIEKGKVLTKDDDYNIIENFNADYSGEASDDEALKLVLESLLIEYPEQAKKWRKMPFHTLSGKANEGGRKGVFFCYRIPEPVSLSDEEIERGVVPGWSTEDGMGESLWFFYDTETEEILDQIGQMSVIHKIIECEPDTARVISLDDETLREIKKKVEKRIKNTIMRTLQAPVKGVKPRLVCWLNIS